MLKKTLLAGALALTASAVTAEPYKDYAPSKEVWTFTYVNVKPGKMDDYLMGLKQTWLSSCEEQKKLGVLLDCSIMVSTNSYSRDFNLMLILKAPNAAVGDPDEATYNKLQAALTARLAKDKRDKLVADYDSMRTMHSEQDFRKVIFK